jgi:translation initiation factor IF-3
MIRIPQVRVVDEEGAQLGLMPTPQALAMAQERGYDLVEVAPMASPPVVKFLDFGQYKYELTKRDKEAKRRQRSVTFKEVRLTPKIGSGDFDTKVHRAIEFLEDGDRIKVTVRFRGRELTHPELGRNMLTRFTDRIKEHGTPERAPLLEGKSMHLTVASLHKPKEHDAPIRPPRPEAVTTANGTAAAAPSIAAADKPATPELTVAASAAADAIPPAAAQQKVPAPAPAAKAEPAAPAAKAEPAAPAAKAEPAAPAAKAEPAAAAKAEPAAAAKAPAAPAATATRTAAEPKTAAPAAKAATTTTKTATTKTASPAKATAARASSKSPASTPAASGE